MTLLTFRLVVYLFNCITYCFMCVGLEVLIKVVRLLFTSIKTSFSILWINAVMCVCALVYRSLIFFYAFHVRVTIQPNYWFYSGRHTQRVFFWTKKATFCRCRHCWLRYIDFTLRIGFWPQNTDSFRLTSDFLRLIYKMRFNGSMK